MHEVTVSIDATKTTAEKQLEILVKKTNEKNIAAVAAKLKRVECTKNKKACDAADKADIALEIASREVKTAKEEYDKVYKVDQNRNVCLREITLTIIDKGLFADVGHEYIADINHTIFRDDLLKMTTNAAGLLSTTKGETTDRTGDIIVEIAKTIAILPGLGQTHVKSLIGILTILELPDDESCIDESATRVIDLSDPLQITKFNNTLKAMKMSVHMEKTYVGNDMGTHSSKKKTTVLKLKNFFEKEFIGLFYRRDLPYLVNLYQGNDCTGKLLNTALITMPNESPLSQVPFSSGAFVKTTHDVQFDNGMLTSWDINRPSEMLALVKIPINVLNAMIESVTQLIQLRISQVNEETSYTKAQTELLLELTKLKEAAESQQSSNQPAEVSE